MMLWSRKLSSGLLSTSIESSKAQYDHATLHSEPRQRWHNIQKVIFHLEAFVAKFMRIYERFVLKSTIRWLFANILDSYLMGMDF